MRCPRCCVSANSRVGPVQGVGCVGAGACGPGKDTDDCNALCTDPLFKLTVGWVPEYGRTLCSQATMSRLENTRSRVEAARITPTVIDTFCRFLHAPRAGITLDVSIHTCNSAHRHRQLWPFHAGPP